MIAIHWSAPVATLKYLGHLCPVMLTDIKKELQKKASKEKAKILQGFFKTGKGEYGEGDTFLGVTVPEQRKTAKKFKAAPKNVIEALLQSGIHEHRLTALLILVEQYQKGDEATKNKIVKLYLKNKAYVNNWDLVDLTAPKILWDHLLDKDRNILHKYAKSKHLWTRRIAVLATYTFIKSGDFKDILRLAKHLLADPHDLMHKAVGWMLREMGKIDAKPLYAFLDKYATKMPRTMLRYAIERIPEEKRKHYMKR